MCSYRPTSLALADRHCARAIDHWESGAPYSREIFQVGIASHACLQAVGEVTNDRGEILDFDQMRAVGREVCARLVETGRKFDGVPEPPMSPKDAFAGRDLALDWLATNQLEPGAMYEAGLGVESDWSVWPYAGLTQPPHSPENPAHPPWLKTAIDYVRIEETESGDRVLVVRDYKTAWPADASYLDHTQRKVQTLLALAHNPDVDVIRREVVNLRSRNTYSDELYLAYPETIEQLDDWRRDIETTIAALEVKPRVASPGPRCLGCPYQGQCEDSREWLETVSPQASPEDMATGYAVALADAARLKSLLVEACGEVPVELADGIVGFQRQSATRLTDGAYGALLDEWGEDNMRGLLHALDLSKTSAEKALKVLYPDRADIDHRKEWLAAHTEPFGKKRFLVTKT